MELSRMRGLLRLFGLWLAVLALLPATAAAQTRLTTATNSLNLVAGNAFSQSYIGIGSIANSYTLVGTPPPGLSLSTTATTATLSGVPTAPGSYSFAIRVLYYSATAGTGTYDSPFSVTVAANLFANPVSATVQANSGANAIAASVSGNVSSIAIATPPAHGTASVSGLGFVYTPATNYVGSDSFSYTASGPGGTTAPALVSIQVVAAPPTAAAATLSVPYATPGSIDLAPFIAGPTFTGVSVSIGSPPGNGRATVSGTRITYTPNTGFSGNDSLTYVATAVGGQSRPAVLSITVGSRPDPSRQGNVIGVLKAGAAAVRHFQSTQIDNVQSRIDQLTGGSGVGGETGKDCGHYALWTAGMAGRGSLGGDGSAALRYSNEAMTFGADRCYGDNMTFGLGIGIGRDRSGQKGDGSTTSSGAASASAYGALRIAPQVQVNWLAGVGRVQFDYDRYVAELADMARGHWSGTQWLSSVSASYQLNVGDLHLTPYGRMDASTLQVDSYAETGGGPFALRYQGQRLSTGRVSAGLSGEYRYEADFGRAVPRVKLEYQRDFAHRRQVGLSYADTPGGQNYVVAADDEERRVVTMSIGSDFYLRNGLSFGFHHTFGRANGGNQSNMTQLRAAQRF
jgi:uncharacterized protein with beta-barrel porin domain